MTVVSVRLRTTNCSTWREDSAGNRSYEVGDNWSPNWKTYWLFSAYETHCCCCFLTLTLVKNPESVVTHRCWSPRKIRKNEWNQNSSGKYYAFPPKMHDAEEGAQVKRSNVQTELTWPRVSTQPQRRVPSFPKLTNSRLQTTAVGLPAAYEPRGNREHRRTRLLSRVLSEWRPAGMQWNKSNRRKKQKTNINDRLSFPSYLTGCSAATTPVPENWNLRRVVPHDEGCTTHVSVTQSSDSSG